jgi:hypothetical protein
MSLLVWLLKNEQQLSRHQRAFRACSKFSAALSAYSSVCELTDMSMESVRGRASDENRSFRPPPWLSSFKAMAS